MNPQASPSRITWSLEVVRGAEPGRQLPLSRPLSILGSAPGNDALDLSSQERPDALRRMAARHASIDLQTGQPHLRDLDSPGGTFVNRQRVPAGQAQALQAGDIIQLGGVQVRLVARPAQVESTTAQAAAASPPPLASSPPSRPPAPKVPAPPPAASRQSAPGPAASRPPLQPSSSRPQPRPSPEPAPSFLFRLASGTSCRTWDDFLRVAGQRWGDLREELTSGRLGAFLAAIERPDLIPSATAQGSADERLDQWLATLPTTRTAVAAIEVHPCRLELAIPEGGRVRHSIHLHNVGHRLLLVRAHVEPAGTPWLTLDRPGEGSITLVDQSQIVVWVQAPQRYEPGHPIAAEVVIQSNGGNQRVEFVISPPRSVAALASGPDVVAGPSRLSVLTARLARQPLALRIAGAAGALFLVRLAMWIAASLVPRLPDEAARWAGPAAMLAVLGAFLGEILCSDTGAHFDRVLGAVSGAVAGVLLATFLVALSRFFDPLATGLLGSLAGPLALWAGLGALLGAAIGAIAKPEPLDPEAAA